MVDFIKCVECGSVFIPTPRYGKVCYSCIRQKRLKTIVNDIKDGKEDIDTSDNEYIICPHCGDMDKASELKPEKHPEAYKDGVYRITCDECGEDFTLETEITFNFDTRKGY